MSCVGGHFAPTLPLDQAVHHRGLHPPAQLSVQGGPQRRQNHQLAALRHVFPAGHERLFLFGAEQGTASATPGPSGGGRALGVVPEAGLQAGHRGPSDSQHSGRLLQGQLGQARQQNGLGHTQLLEVMCLGHHPLGFGHQVRVDSSGSCHAPSIAHLVSS